uniref:Uncharacterized protein n=1 Tax=Nelumbo nucifera TaxID=4432 RepID=A0A822YHF1_NELNU|nr:TPA_asm: hypothetical protein HUJ06_010404 [Nelumbo nucifera]
MLTVPVGFGAGFLILKTHDFLQPLERLGKKSGKGENTVEAAPNPIEKPLPPPPPSVEHALPGGIGTYSIGYNSNFNHRSVPPKPETSVFSPTSSTEKNGEVNNKANSNGGSYSGGAFSLWNQSVVKEKGALVKLKDTVAQETQVVKGNTFPFLLYIVLKTTAGTRKKYTPININDRVSGSVLCNLSNPMLMAVSHFHFHLSAA